MEIFLIDTVFSRCHSDPNAYTKKVGRNYLGGSPHKELTSWRKSLNFAHHGEKSLTFHTMEKNSLKC
jgi:hypothetical protein